jgi:L-glyceraldehyde 3-phosphate reductase
VHLADADRHDRLPLRRAGGLDLPLVTLGLWQNFGDATPFADQRALVLRAFDLGIVHLDLANNYGPPPGAAEESVGRLLAGDLAPYRDELLIATKAGYRQWPGPYGEFGSRKYLLASLDQSLRRLGTDHVDVFYSHRFDPRTPLTETIGALKTAVDSGRARYAGISSYSARRTAEALAAVAERRGQTLAQLAITWVLRDTRVTSVALGARTAAQLEENLAAVHADPLSDADLAEIDRYAVDGGINLWGSRSSEL